MNEQSKPKTPYAKDLTKKDLWDFLGQTANPGTKREQEKIIAAKTIAYAEAAWAFGQLEPNDALELIIAAEIWL